MSRRSTAGASAPSGWRPRSRSDPTAGRAWRSSSALLEAQRAAGSALAARLLEGDLAAVTWLVEPLPVAEPAVAPQPDRNPTVPVPMPTPVEGGATVGSAWGSVTPG